MPWYLLALIAAIMLGAYSIIEKRALSKTDPLSFLLISNVFITLFSLPIILNRDIFIFTNPELALIIVRSFFAALFFLLIAKALEKMEISEFAPFLSFSPAIVLILSFFFLGETVSLISLLGIFLIIAGAYVIELKDGIFSPLKAIKESDGIHYIFLGLFFGAICAIIDRSILSRGPDVLAFFFLNNVFVLLFFSTFSFLRRENIKKLNHNFKPAILWAILGALFYMGGDILYFKALTIPTALVALVIALKRLSILISTLVGGELFHENNLLKKTIATLIMIGGVFLIIF